MFFTIQGLTWDYYESMSKSGAFPLYSLVIALNVIFIVLSVFNRWSGNKDKLEDEELEPQHQGPNGRGRGAKEGLTYRYYKNTFKMSKEENRGFHIYLGHS